MVEVLLYVHRNRRFVRDGSPGRPPPELWRGPHLLNIYCDLYGSEHRDDLLIGTPPSSLLSPVPQKSYVASVDFQHHKNKPGPKQLLIVGLFVVVVVVWVGFCLFVCLFV